MGLFDTIKWFNGVKSVRAILLSSMFQSKKCFKLMIKHVKITIFVNVLFQNTDFYIPNRQKIQISKKKLTKLLVNSFKYRPWKDKYSSQICKCNNKHCVKDNFCWHMQSLISVQEIKVALPSQYFSNRKSRDNKWLVKISWFTVYQLTISPLAHMYIQYTYQ